MKKQILTFLTITLALSFATASFFELNDAGTRKLELSSNLSELQLDYDKLQTKYYALLGNYTALQNEYQGVLLPNSSFVPNPGSEPLGNQQMLSRYQELQQMFTALQAEYNEFIRNYQNLKGMTDLRLMQADLRSLITPDDPAVVQLVHKITGKVGNITDPDSYWKDIKAMYDWVVANIEYRKDGLYPKLLGSPKDTLADGLEFTDQMAQFANETLSLKKGDCEDMSILLTSMIRAYFSKQFTVENIWITGSTAGDVAVVIPFSNDRIVILNPSLRYYSHDALGNIAANDISSEIYNWLSTWRPSLGNNVRVYRVFSDYIDKHFDGTEEYINWMYTR